MASRGHAQAAKAGVDLGGVRGPQRAVFSDGWRGVFYVNLPIGLIALVLAAPPASTVGSGSGDTHLDLVGSLLLGGGVLSLVLVVNGEMIGPDRLSWLYLAPVLLLVAFARWEVRTGRRGRQRLLDPRLARTSGYAGRIGHGLPGVRYPYGWRARYLARCGAGALDLTGALSRTPRDAGIY